MSKSKVVIELQIYHTHPSSIYSLILSVHQNLTHPQGKNKMAK